jgi:DNA-binding transcriptional MerR regulator
MSLESGQTDSYTLPELAAEVNGWCRDQGVLPSSGQAAEDLSERTLRFYRTVGLLDAPDCGGGRGYGEKHFLQLVAVRLLQARGLPLRRIRELLQSRPLEDLRRIRAEGLAELTGEVGLPPRWSPPARPETWRMIPLNGDFFLMSRGAGDPDARVLAEIRKLLQS